MPSSVGLHLRAWKPGKRVTSDSGSGLPPPGVEKHLLGL